MEKFKPKLFSVMKNYNKEMFFKDLISGLIVAMIAFPLAIAFSIASAVTPEKGIYTAIIAGFIISFLGGSRVQISGPTAAFATIVAAVVLDKDKGLEGMATAAILAGIIIVLMGVFRFGNLLKYVPLTITIGFTSGLAITIFVGQIKDFLGLNYLASDKNITVIEKVTNVIKRVDTMDIFALLVGISAILILVIWPKINKLIPASLIAILVVSFAVKMLDLDVKTIGNTYNLKNAMPSLVMPDLSFEMIKRVLPDAFAIALISSLESLLSCVVSDGMIGSKHRSNMELVAQGTGNIVSGLFGGLPASGAIARTTANVNNGGRTPIAGMVHAITLLIIFVFLLPLASMIPMPVMAAILFIVSYNMSEWRKFVDIIKTSPRSDILVLLVTFSFTIIFGLAIALISGLLLGSILFMKRMSDETNISAWEYVDDYDDDLDKSNLRFKKVPKHTRVFEINGPLFFAITQKLNDIIIDKKTKVLIIRMRNVNAIDATAVNGLKKIIKKYTDSNIKVVLSHVNEQPLEVIKKSGIIEMIGEEGITSSIDDALELASCITV